MKIRIGVLVLIVVFATTIKTFAQLPIPPMDVNLLGGYSILNGFSSSSHTKYRNRDFEGINVSGSLMIHLNENIAVGPFFSQGVQMNFNENEFASNSGGDASQSILGLNGRLSTNRNGRFRPYINLSYFRLKLVGDTGDLRFEQKTAGFGAGLGLMIKLSRNFYWNAFEVSLHQIADEIFFLNGVDHIVQLQTGVSYNFGKKK